MTYWHEVYIGTITNVPGNQALVQFKAFYSKERLKKFTLM